MKLSNYNISGKSGEKVINFNNPNLVTLESLLNGDITDEKTFDLFLTKLYYLKNNWSELDTIVETKYRGYWDEEILNNFNITGNWFLFGGTEDIILYINKANQHIFIYNEMLDSEPVVELALDEFINILEQWRKIQIGVKR